MADAGAEHTVTFDNPKLVSSGPLGVGKGHEVIIYEPGTYTYRCTIHPAMAGSIVVTPEAAATTAPPLRARRHHGADHGGPPPPRRRGSDGGSSTGVIVGVGAAGVAVAAGLGWLLLRRRPGSPAADD